MTPPSREVVIADLALAYHKAMDGTGEGEYGCPGLECPGVQRLAAFGLKCADAVALVQSDGWRPIEDAPKDGTRFIAWGPNVAVAECEYRAAWFSYPAGWYRTNQHPRVEITRWMPLPDPPRPQEPR